MNYLFLAGFMTTVLLQTLFKKPEDQCCQLEIGQKAHFLPDRHGSRRTPVAAAWSGRAYMKGSGSPREPICFRFWSGCEGSFRFSEGSAPLES